MKEIKMDQEKKKRDTIRDLINLLIFVLVVDLSYKKQNYILMSLGILCGAYCLISLRASMKLSPESIYLSENRLDYLGKSYEFKDYKFEYLPGNLIKANKLKIRRKEDEKNIGNINLSLVKEEDQKDLKALAGI